MNDMKPAMPRSPHWPAARAEHLRREPCCAACGGTTHLEVHHVLPFHVFPEHELDQDNMMTMCEEPSRNCHHTHGHSLNWSGWNPHVRDDAAVFRSRVAASNALAKAPVPVRPAPPGE